MYHYWRMWLKTLGIYDWIIIYYHGLDPARYYTLPNFAWDAMLLKAGVEIDMIYD